MENVPGEEWEVTQMEHTTDNKHIIIDTYQWIMLDLSSFWDFWISSSFCKPETPLHTTACFICFCLWSVSVIFIWHLTSPVVRSWADIWSSMNFCHLYSNQNKHWHSNLWNQSNVENFSDVGGFLELPFFCWRNEGQQHPYCNISIHLPPLQISPARYIFRPSLRTHRNSTRIH